MITGNSIRGARGLLGWSASTLAQKSRVGVATILRIERNSRSAYAQNRTLERIERTLAEAGLVIVEDTNGVIDIHFEPHDDADATRQ
jgi:transcriptional regulator with XRE-family HTH domain